MKKFLATLSVFAVFFAAFAGCKKGGSGEKVGISMPTQSLQRWNQDGANMKAQFEKAGFDVDLQYAGDNDIPTQVAQIENMIATGCKVIVIAAVDGSSLTEVLKTAVTLLNGERVI